jgi:hypothetical protein
MSFSAASEPMSFPVAAGQTTFAVMLVGTCSTVAMASEEMIPSRVAPVETSAEQIEEIERGAADVACRRR